MHSNSPQQILEVMHAQDIFNSPYRQYLKPPI